ncbi:hypothetical protein SUGI_1027030 [Cryptomeria japonica]|nr:hypothetical protein SUGI_1027030 [Cryptomeria japonica]
MTINYGRPRVLCQRLNSIFNAFQSIHRWKFKGNGYHSDVIKEGIWSVGCEYAVMVGVGVEESEEESMGDELPKLHHRINVTLKRKRDEKSVC